MITLASKVLLGHNRQATVGVVNSANAHPFTHGDITLAHNGTLPAYVKSRLEKEYDAPSFSTDSELVCWLIDNYDLACVMKDLEGAFALTWWDASDNSLNFINNGEREFSYVVDRQNIYWCSEAKMLEWLLDRNNLAYKDMVVVQPEPGVHDKFVFAENGYSFTHTSQTLELKPKKPKAGTTGTTGSTSRQPAGNVHSLPHRDPYADFLKKYGYSLRQGSVFYAYKSDISRAVYPQGGTKVDIKATLAAEPFCNVSVWHVDNCEEFDSSDLIGFKMVVSGIRKVGNEFVITARNTEVSPVVSDDEVDAMEAWEAGLVKPAPVTVDISPEDARVINDVVPFYTGYQKARLTYSQFKHVLDKGCCICGDPISAEAEALDRSCTFVDDHSAVCEVCASDHHTMATYGY